MNDYSGQFGLNTNKFQVFLFICPVTIPLNFAVHPWFVVNEKGKVSRWEVLHRDVAHKFKWGHLYKDFFSPFQGLEKILFYKKWFFKPKLLGKIEDEPAKQLAKLINDSQSTYPYRFKYSFLGPNSNTYAQWVLNNSPEFKAYLPWNAFGKNYELK